VVKSPIYSNREDSSSISASADVSIFHLYPHGVRNISMHLLLRDVLENIVDTILRR